MNLGRTVFAQLISFLPDREFRRCVSRYDGDHRSQLLRLGSVPIDGFRPADFLPRKPPRYRSVPAFAFRQALPHGIRCPVARSTLADANESRDWRIYADFAQVLIRIARPLYARDPIGVDLDQTLSLWTRPPSTCASRCSRGPSSAGTRLL